MTFLLPPGIKGLRKKQQKFTKKVLKMAKTTKNPAEGHQILEVEEKEEEKILPIIKLLIS